MKTMKYNEINKQTLYNLNLTHTKKYKINSCHDDGASPVIPAAGENVEMLTRGCLSLEHLKISRAVQVLDARRYLHRGTVKQQQKEL